MEYSFLMSKQHNIEISYSFKYILQVGTLSKNMEMWFDCQCDNYPPKKFIEVDVTIYRQPYGL